MTFNTVSISSDEEVADVTKGLFQAVSIEKECGVHLLSLSDIPMFCGSFCVYGAED